MSMFEIASRKNLRFETTKGFVTVEALWDIPLTTKTDNPSLDGIAKYLNKQIKEAGDSESFVTKASGPNETLLLKFEIVKYIIGVRLAENEETARKVKAKEQKQQILSLIAQKENEQLSTTSLEDLRKMAEAL